MCVSVQYRRNRVLPGNHTKGAPKTDAANTEFTTEELLSQAQGNATAFVPSTIATQLVLFRSSSRQVGASPS